MIRLCETPRSFTAIKKELGISDPGLTKQLKALQKLGWLQKRPEGYELTRAGRRILPQAQRAEILSLDFKTSPILVKNVTVNHQGLEGDDGETLLSDIAQGIRRYIAKHSEMPLTLMIQYNPLGDKHATPPMPVEPHGDPSS